VVIIIDIEVPVQIMGKKGKQAGKAGDGAAAATPSPNKGRARFGESGRQPFGALHLDSGP